MPDKTSPVPGPVLDKYMRTGGCCAKGEVLNPTLQQMGTLKGAIIFKRFGSPERRASFATRYGLFERRLGGTASKSTDAAASYLSVIAPFGSFLP
jgi:translation initiation factor 2 gamma subunit (eIF-2gamma)